MEHVQKEIHKENEMRKIRNIVEKQALDILKPFVGCKIKKVDGCIVKKAKDLLKFSSELNITPLKKGGYTSANIWMRCTDYSLSVCVSISFSGGRYEDSNFYNEIKKDEFYVGNIDKSILQGIHTFESIPMLSAEVQQEQYNKVETIKAEFEKENAKLWRGVRLAR